MPDSHPFRLKSAILKLPTAIPVLFALLLAGSWRRWTSLIADSGREMDLPLRLLRGEMLYQDVHHIYPPFSPYFNALLYHLFGAHLDVLLASGIVCAALIVFLCWRMAVCVLPGSEAVLASLAIIVWCVFKPSGNLISPYSYAALHGTTLALGATLLALRYAERQHLRELLAAGLLIGLCSVSKQEFALAAVLAVAASLLAAHRGQYRLIMARLSATAAVAALIALPVYGWAFRRVGWHMLIADCHLFFTHLPQSLIFYNRHRTGMDAPLASLVQMFGGFAAAAAAAGVIILISALSLRRIKHSEAVGTEPGYLVLRAGLVVAIAAAVGFAVNHVSGGRWDGSPLRALPIALAGLMFYAWRRMGRDGLLPVASVHRALFILAVYSLAVLARVLLRVPSGGAFGGFFLPTSLILIVWLTTRALPRAIEDWTRNQKLAARARLLGRTLLLAALIITSVVFVVRYRRYFNVLVTAPQGTLYAHRVTGGAINEALAFIQEHTAPGEAIAVVPEGSDLAFLTGRRMPLRHQIMIPGFMDEAEERRAIDVLEQQHVRYVFLVNRPMREFGQEAFGRDFYHQFGATLSRDYRVVKVCGIADENLSQPPEIGDPRFFISVHERLPTTQQIR